MAWYRTGTVTVTNVQTAVTGSGTAWLSNSRVGDAFVGPDGKMYEITGISADNAMAIYPPYAGTSASGQSYAIIPVPGYTKKLADQAAELINDYDDALQKPWNVAETPADVRTELELGNAATKTVGTATGNLMEVGAFGVGSKILTDIYAAGGTNLANFGGGFSYTSTVGPGSPSTDSAMPRANILTMPGQSNDHYARFWATRANLSSYPKLYFMTSFGSTVRPYVEMLSKGNTTTDTNGFIKAASPIINLYADKIELNDEAKQQNIELVVNGIGDYTITGTSGFAQDGWYVTTPTDANNMAKVNVKYQQELQADGTYSLTVKTFEPRYKLNDIGEFECIGQPCDITSERFISIRLQPLPIPEIAPEEVE
ncbi:hypothetical protein [Shewanella fodinae]|uniref:phage tail fiber protein n=1 Tax=Shewanella fodinae TaxID=552357 RepID=UPI001679F1B3|nr:hypothetical protein [Shewanella fodinae]MCL2905242.1 hypothetical protein [Shewanella fodinae]GGY87544.1 hypothetical protein GCM10007169_00830 [Shewanella fodinae]